MEPGNTGTGNVAEDQTAAAQPPTHKNLGTAATIREKPRTATQDSASVSEPGNRSQQQAGTNKSDGR